MNIKTRVKIVLLLYYLSILATLVTVLLFRTIYVVFVGLGTLLFVLYGFPVRFISYEYRKLVVALREMGDVACPVYSLIFMLIFYCFVMYGTAPGIVYFTMADVLTLLLYYAVFESLIDNVRKRASHHIDKINSMVMQYVGQLSDMESVLTRKFRYLNIALAAVLIIVVICLAATSSFPLHVGKMISFTVLK